LAVQYRNLEEELMKLIKDGMLEVEKFTEQTVGVKLFDLNRHRIQIEARQKHMQSPGLFML